MRKSELIKQVRFLEGKVEGLRKTAECFQLIAKDLSKAAFKSIKIADNNKALKKEIKKSKSLHDIGREISKDLKVVKMENSRLKKELGDRENAVVGLVKRNEKLISDNKRGRVIEHWVENELRGYCHEIGSDELIKSYNEFVEDGRIIGYNVFK